MNLYNLSKEHSDFMASIEQIDGLTDELKEELVQDSADQVQAKFAAYSAFIKDLKLDEEKIKGEMARLSEKLTPIENKRAHMEKMAIECMLFLDMKSAGNVVHSLTLPKPRSSLKIDDKEKIPKEFITPHVEYRIDNAAIKQRLEDGETIDGAHLEYKQTLKVK